MAPPSALVSPSERTRLWRLRQAIDLPSWITLLGPDSILDPSSPEAAPAEALLLLWESEFGAFPAAGSRETRLRTWTGALKKAFKAAGEPFSLFDCSTRLQALGELPARAHVFFPVRLPASPGFLEEWGRLIRPSSSAPSCSTLVRRAPKRQRSPPPKKTVFKKRTRQDDPSPIYSLPTSALERLHCIMSTDSTPHACALSFLSLCLGCTDNSGDAPWHRRAEEAANDHGTAHSRRDVNAHGRASVGSATLAQGRGIGADIAP